MAIDRLGSTASLIAALRAEVKGKSGRVDIRDTAPARTAPAATSSKARDPDALRRELAALVKDVPPDDARALDEVRPRIIRSVLLWEFGQNLREYGEWQPMLDRITRTLERNEQHRAEFAQMVRELQRC